MPPPDNQIGRLGILGVEEVNHIEEWQCSKCTLVIRVAHPNTLAIDKALHLKKHGIRGE
jgi:hypothetical protein